MTAGTDTSDKQLGLTIMLGLFVLAGAAGMLFAPGDAIGATGFAVAIVAGLALVAAIHLLP